MALEIDIDLAPDGTWIASVPDLRVEVRRSSREDALRTIQVQALRALAERLLRGSIPPFDAFGVTAREGANILGLRARTAGTYRSLQEGAAGLAVTDEEIEEEIRLARAEASDVDPAASRNEFDRARR